MISKNPIMLLSGVINFLNRHADLEKYNLVISHETIHGFNDQSGPVKIVKLRLMRKKWVFQSVVWTIRWHEGFREHIQLPDVLCRCVTPPRPQTQATLFDDVSSVEDNNSVERFTPQHA